MTILSSIGISPIPLAGQIVSFLVVYFVFKKYLFGPILENLDKRAKKQQEAVKAAEESIRIKDELASTQSKMKQKLQEDIRKEFAKAEKAAAEKRDELVVKARSEAKKEAEKQYEEFEKKMQAKEKEAREKLSDLVINTTRKILQEHLGSKTEKGIVAEEIKKLEKIKI